MQSSIIKLARWKCHVLLCVSAETWSSSFPCSCYILASDTPPRHKWKPDLRMDDPLCHWLLRFKLLAFKRSSGSLKFCGISLHRHSYTAVEIGSGFEPAVVWICFNFSIAFQEKLTLKDPVFELIAEMSHAVVHSSVT